MIGEEQVRAVLGDVAAGGGLWAHGMAVRVHGALAGARRSARAVSPEQACQWAAEARWPENETQVLRGLAIHASKGCRDIGALTVLVEDGSPVIRLTCDERRLSTAAMLQILIGTVGELTAADCLRATGVTRGEVGRLRDRLTGSEPRRWAEESPHHEWQERLRAERGHTTPVLQTPEEPIQRTREEEATRLRERVTRGLRFARRAGGFASTEGVEMLHLLPVLDDPDPLLTDREVADLALQLGWGPDDLPALRGIALSRTHEAAAAEQLLAVPADESRLRHTLTLDEARIAIGALDSIRTGPRRVRSSEIHAFTGFFPFQLEVLSTAYHAALTTLSD